MIIDSKATKIIPIGRLGENEARIIEFHVGNILRDFPDASFIVMHQRPGDPVAYIVDSQYVELDGNSLLWTIQSGDLATEGIGCCEVRATQDDAIIKTEIYNTRIEKALDGSAEPPDPWDSWVNEVLNAKEEAEESAEDAEAWAVGKRGGEDVESDDPAYHNNSKYYAEEAAASATEAQTAAASASAAYGTALLAPNYSTTATYKVGDHVIYSGNYYVCKTAITTAEAWTAAHWTQVTVGGESADLKSAINGLHNVVFIDPSMPFDLRTVSYTASRAKFKYENDRLALRIFGTTSSSQAVSYDTSAGLSDESSIYQTYDPADPLQIKVDYAITMPSGAEAKLYVRYKTEGFSNTYYNICALLKTSSSSGIVTINLKELWLKEHPNTDTTRIKGVTIRSAAFARGEAGSGDYDIAFDVYGFYKESEIDYGTNVRESVDILYGDVNHLYKRYNDSQNLNGLLLLNSIPSYFKDDPANPSDFDDINHLESKIYAIPEGRKFFFITDTHWDDGDNAQHSPNILGYLKNRLKISNCLFGGDFMNGDPTKYGANQIMHDFYSKMFSVFGDRLYTAIGNHDQNLANYLDGHTPEEIAAKFLPYKEVYKCVYAPIANKMHTFWDDTYWTFSTNTTTNTSTWTDNGITNGDKIKLLANDSSKNDELEAYGKMTYYVDDPEMKIRTVVIMCLDKPDYGTWYDLFEGDTVRPYIGWMYHALLSTPKGYDICICSHTMGLPYNTTSVGSNLAGIATLMLMGLKLKANKRMYHSNNISTNELAFFSNKQFYCDFTNANNVGRAFCIAGHSHTDGITVVNQSTDYYYTATRSIYNNETLNQRVDATAGEQDYNGCPIPIIWTTTDAFGRWEDGAEDYPSGVKTEMTEGTVTEQAFDIVTMTDGGINLTRIGAGNNREIKMIW